MASPQQRIGQSTVVITGASAGVGRAIAHRFARAGAKVALLARDGDALRKVKEEIERIGGSAMMFPLDVAEADAVFNAADQIVAATGTIDIWINDAMVTVFSPVWDITPEEFRRVTEVTYLGFVHGTMAALRHMRSRNRGTIIQIGSALAYRGIPLQSAYCGAKYAMRGFTDSLRTELIHDASAIALTIVELPAVNTPQFDWARTHMPRQPRPVAPVIEPEAIAEIVFRAAMKPQREYWTGLSSLKVILGNMVLPEFLDRYLAKNAYGAQETAVPVTPGRRDNLMAPVSGLHRTRGRFGSEAADSVIAVPGPTARFATVLAGALTFLSLGLVLGLRLRRPKVDALARLRRQLLR